MLKTLISHKPCLLYMWSSISVLQTLKQICRLQQMATLSIALCLFLFPKYIVDSVRRFDKVFDIVPTSLFSEKAGFVAWRKSRFPEDF